MKAWKHLIVFMVWWLIPYIFAKWREPLAWHWVRVVYTKARLEDYSSKRACRIWPPSEAAMPQVRYLTINLYVLLLIVLLMSSTCVGFRILCCMFLVNGGSWNLENTAFVLVFWFVFLLQVHEALLVIASSYAWILFYRLKNRQVSAPPPVFSFLWTYFSISLCCKEVCNYDVLLAG